MPKNWSALATTSDNLYAEDDFKQAFYQLVCSQVLYAKDQTQSVSYALIARYRAEVREAADLLGLRLEFNDTYRYCLVIPYTSKQQLMDTNETLLLLVMRRLYHGRALVGDIEMGEATVSIPDLIAAFKAATQRDLPAHTGELREMIQRMRRYGVARVGRQIDDDPQPFPIIILPAITDILSESAMGRLGAYQNASVEVTTKMDGQQAATTPDEEGDSYEIA